MFTLSVEKYLEENNLPLNCLQACCSINIFSGNAMTHFENISKRRQKQSSLDRFLMRQRPRESQAKLSSGKRQEREKEQIPERQLLIPYVFMKGNSPYQTIASFPLSFLTHTYTYTINSPSYSYCNIILGKFLSIFYQFNIVFIFYFLLNLKIFIGCVYEFVHKVLLSKLE